MAAAALIAVWGRQRLSVFDSPADVSSSVAVVGPLIVAGWLALVAISGGYKDDVFGVGTDEYKRVLNASLLTSGLLGVGCYLAKYPLSRGFFLLLFCIGVPALLLGRLALRRAVQRARAQGKLQLRVLISGWPHHIDEVAAVLRRESWLGYHVVGALTPQGEEGEETDAGLPVVGCSDAATEAVKTVGADVVFFASGALTSSTQLRRIAWDLEKEDVQVVVAPSVTDVSSERVRIRPVGGLPLMHIDPPRATDASRWGKRAFDIVGSMVLIVFLSPLFILVATAIRLHDGGPVLFRHTRIGKDGKPFACYKFRTMVVDAEAMIETLREDAGHAALLFKLKADPRVTKPGRLLRRYSIDELPQLFNVLGGSMSLVGPRPQVEREVAEYDNHMVRRLRVRPGMTGLWQVSGRNDLTADEAIRLDLYYVDNWSMVQDLAILLRTVGAVLGSRGAY